MSNLGWLRELCDETHPSSSLHEPFVVRENSRSWACAATQASVVALRVYDEPFRPINAEDDARSTILDVLRRRPNVATVELMRLKDWCERVAKVQGVVCTTCKGAGFVPCPGKCRNGRVRVVCRDCDLEHPCICKSCVRQGWPPGRVPCIQCHNARAIAPGWVGDLLVDTELLRRCLDNFDSYEVGVGISESLLIVQTRTWRVAIMKMIPKDSDKDAPKFL